MSDTFPPRGLDALFQVVHRLRAPGGCPWDREQTHRSLRPFLLEEAYEAAEAIDLEDEAKLKEELGDVLLQVAMHAEIAAEAGRFDAVQVSEAAAAKMIARHPHVFGDVEASTADQVLTNWERRKAAEPGAAASVFDRVPTAQPALAWSQALQGRAARVGLREENLGSPSRLTALLEQLVSQEVGGGEALGDLLFGLVALADARKLDPEGELRLAGKRFRARLEGGEVEPTG